MSALWFSLPKPRILAHRGLATVGAENTLLAFQSAWDAGARYLETDVHLTADNIVVAAHDDSLVRLAGLDMRIADHSFAELNRRLDATHQLPTLSELLGVFPSAMWNIDVKSDAAVPFAAGIIRDSGLARRVLLANFDDARAERMSTLLPECAKSAPARQLALITGLLKMGLDRAAQRALHGYDAVQGPLSYRQVAVLTPRVIAGLKRLGIEVHVWTVNEPDVMRKLFDQGVDGVFTDRVDLGLDIAKDYR